MNLSLPIPFTENQRASCSKTRHRARRALRLSASAGAPPSPQRARPSAHPGRPPALSSRSRPLRPVPRARPRPWRGPWRAPQRRAGPWGRGGRRRSSFPRCSRHRPPGAAGRPRGERREREQQPPRRRRSEACMESKGQTARRLLGPWRARPQRAGRGRRPVFLFVRGGRREEEEVERREKEEESNAQSIPSSLRFGSLQSFFSTQFAHHLKRAREMLALRGRRRKKKSWAGLCFEGEIASRFFSVSQF